MRLRFTISPPATLGLSEDRIPIGLLRGMYLGLFLLATVVQPGHLLHGSPIMRPTFEWVSGGVAPVIGDVQREAGAG